ncbi:MULTISPECIES: cold-shock protein [Paenibacillus]|uniref:Cold-shock protein n=1 Tax=Paenibacillus lignilyticus TaxID=1172615 RepID=A0ABS5CGI3_9BACL|nr:MULTISPECIES: cold-shock protein [Paenibacillus]MBP3964944.1 cold-shock protein [Paenibacillus lignilyticus]SDW94400.1 Cold-inducible protein YdjO [Paenibacillus sp. CF384]SFT24699.1 Cold-inducible protein YdjO [Paenibacillus sp. BC26]
MYNRKKIVEDIPEENTAIWSCETEGCKSWMRDNFAFDVAPSCHVHHTPMVKSMKMLPALNNNNSLKSSKN